MAYRTHGLGVSVGAGGRRAGHGQGDRHPQLDTLLGISIAARRPGFILGALLG